MVTTLTKQDGVYRASDSDNRNAVLFLFENFCNLSERFLDLGAVELWVNDACCIGGCIRNGRGWYYSLREAYQADQASHEGWQYRIWVRLNSFPFFLTIFFSFSFNEV